MPNPAGRAIGRCVRFVSPCIRPWAITNAPLRTIEQQSRPIVILLGSVRYGCAVAACPIGGGLPRPVAAMPVAKFGCVRWSDLTCSLAFGRMRPKGKFKQAREIQCLAI